MPETNTYEIEGMPFEISTKLREGLFRQEEVLCIRGDAQDFLRLSDEARFSQNVWAIIEFQAIDEGFVVRTETSLYYLRSALKAYFRDKEVARHRQTEVVLVQQCEMLERAGFSVALLRKLLRKVDQQIDEFFWRPHGPGDILGAFRAAERELERVRKMPTEVLVRDILEERVWHRDHKENLRVLKTLEQLEIRSGGAIEAVSAEWLVEYYVMALEGVETVDRAGVVSLGVSLDDFVSKEKREDPAIMELMAPESLELAGRKGTKWYPIEYGYSEVDGDRVPIGHLTVPLSVYDRQSGHPELPHGIRLVVSLTVEDKVVVVGVADETLEGRIKKYRRSRSRSGA